MVLILKSIPKKDDCNQELLTDCGHVAGGELVFGEAQQNAGFSDGAVADNDQLDQVVVLLLCSCRVHFRIN